MVRLDLSEQRLEHFSMEYHVVRDAREVPLARLWLGRIRQARQQALHVIEVWLMVLGSRRVQASYSQFSALPISSKSMLSISFINILALTGGAVCDPVHR